MPNLKKAIEHASYLIKYSDPNTEDKNVLACLKAYERDKGKLREAVLKDVVNLANSLAEGFGESPNGIRAYKRISRIIQNRIDVESHQQPGSEG